MDQIGTMTCPVTRHFHVLFCAMTTFFGLQLRAVANVGSLQIPSEERSRSGFRAFAISSNAGPVAMLGIMSVCRIVCCVVPGHHQCVSSLDCVTDGHIPSLNCDL